MSGEERFLMCVPRFYRVAYVINPWMEGNVGRARADVAERQWEALREALAAHAAIALVDPAPDLPDMPFTANAGLVHDDTFVPARFRFPQRRPEAALVTAWAREHGLHVAELPGSGTFEGEGDALFQPGEPLLWGGYGVRTALEAHRDLAHLLDVELVPLRLVDERFYHLDTCFCPLPGGRVLYYPDAFDRDALAAIAARVPPERRLEVEAADALRFACNAVVAGDVIVTNHASPALQAGLARWGHRVLVVPLDEFILAGGAAKCLVLRLVHRGAVRTPSAPPVASPMREGRVEVQGHLLDTGLMNRLLDAVTEGGGSFEIESLQAGLRHDQDSLARVRVVAPSAERLATILDRLMQLGARPVEPETDARLETVAQAGVAPRDFYSTTIYATEVRVGGRWIRATGQRMDAVLVVGGTPEAPWVACRLLRDLAPGDRVVCGIEGVRTHPPPAARAADGFGFMSAEVSSERRVELAVERVAWEMRRVRERGGRIVVVGGPVVIHTGGGPLLAALVRRGHVQALLAGNGLAVHDIEQALYGTALGVDLKRGTPVVGGHRHHLQAINLVRAAGGIARAVVHGVLQSGIMYECVTHGVPFALAGSIRDDGPLPETMMDLVAAQAAYAGLLEGADMVLMLSSMLHSIGVGNMTPAGVRRICVDISPAVVTKLMDRGSVDSTGIVTDVGLFLNLLDAGLAPGG
jgi:lysine-ketoglutarate reductase/saccharopine dehydrogenase-like protein (TIGR00300 family)